jgi:hypothetical protein
MVNSCFDFFLFDSVREIIHRFTFDFICILRLATESKDSVASLFKIICVYYYLNFDFVLSFQVNNSLISFCMFKENESWFKLSIA